MRRLLPWLAIAVVVAACTEQLTTPGGCPQLCPGGPPVLRDTVLNAIPGLDSSFTGFTSPSIGVSLPLSNGGALGESRAIIRFLPRGDSVFVGDTAYPVNPDSMVLQLVLQERDTTRGGLGLKIFRLPASTDTLSSWDDVTAAMTPENLLRRISIPDSTRVGPFRFHFSGEQLQALEIPPEDSGQFVLGLELEAPTPGAGAYFGAARSGAGSPLLQIWSDVPVEDTTGLAGLSQSRVQRNFMIHPAPTAVGPDQLLIGGDPASRALIRFPWPEYLRDSATIVRATLTVTQAANTVTASIPGDSTAMIVEGLFVDFGSKSVIAQQPADTLYLRQGDNSLSFEVTDIVSLWQGTSPLEPALRVRINQEWSTFLDLLINSSEAGSGTPQLRITYRPPYKVLQ